MAKISEKNYKVMYRDVINKTKNNQEEIGELVIIQNGIAYKTYKNNILTSPFTKSLSEKDKEILFETLQPVEEYENKLIEIELPVAVQLIDSYIKSKALTVKQYCEENEISAETFERAKRIVSLYDKERYTKFNTEQKVKDLIRNKLVTEELEKMVFLIKNGVELEDGTVRGFDLIDYYECTSVPPKNLYISINTKKIVPTSINPRDLLEVKKYLHKVTTNVFNSNPINVERKLNDVVKFAEKDENGKIIEGSFRTIDESEKISLIEYLNANRIPLIEGTYEAGIRRIRNNTFGKEEKNKESKMNKQLVLK